MSLRNSIRPFQTFSMTVAALATVIAMSACSDLPTKTTSSRKTSSLISKAAWMNVLPTTMSDEFCDSESELLQCYPLSQDDCHQNVEAITTNCVNSYSGEIPARLGKAAASTWGGTIGNCTKNGILQMIEAKNLTANDEACRQTVEDM